MKLAAVSDLHGFLPTVPERVDTLIVAGDISPQFLEGDVALMLMWLDTNFRSWLEDTRAGGVQHILGIAGNHDSILQYEDEVAELELPWIYLRDSGAEIDGLKFYGLPWVANLRGWPFYLPQEDLAARYGEISDDTDVIISHSPPMGYGDGGHPEWSSSVINDAIKRVQPQALVCGHIHQGYGVYQHRSVPTKIYNVSFVDENYRSQSRITKVVAHARSRD